MPTGKVQRLKTGTGTQQKVGHDVPSQKPN
jgi:hypothetical protein